MVFCGPKSAKVGPALSAPGGIPSAFLDVLANRRSRYALGRNVKLSSDDLIKIITRAARDAPTPMNCQSARIVILLGDNSEAVWSITGEALRKVVPAADFGSTEGKMKSFAAGVGTVLFYEDQDVVKDLQARFPSYAATFPTYSEQSSGMVQYAVWTALSAAGIGASLQHYNPLPDADLAAKFDIPASWKLSAQMPFGSIEGPDSTKTYIDDAVRFKIFK